MHLVVGGRVAVMSYQSLEDRIVKRFMQGRANAAGGGSRYAPEAPQDAPAFTLPFRRAIGADSLGYVSVDGMIEATRQKRDQLCTACFSGEYPLGLPAGNSNADAVRTLLGTK